MAFKPKTSLPKPGIRDLGKKIGDGKVVHYHQAFELLGSKGTTTHKDAEINVYEWGVHLVSRKTNRELIIWNTNCRGAELLPVVPKTEAV